MPSSSERDVALVLSGGGINGVLLELGFLKRLHEHRLWPRVGWIYGTSAGALAGTMAALERLDDLEEFVLGLQPEDAFRPRPVWRLPGGPHDYTLPATIAGRIGEPHELGTALAAAEIELVVFATDVSEHPDADETRDFELAYGSHSTGPEAMGRAILASAAISGLVLPVSVDGVIATDGGWVRNYPLAHAYARPGVRMIVAFRYVPRFPGVATDGLGRLRKRLERFRAVPPIRAFIAELNEAEERSRAGEPAHLPEMILRLTRAAIVRNTVIEEKTAEERDESIRAYRDQVREWLDADDVALVDVRSPGEFAGELIAPPGYEQEGAQRAGHIPTAVSIPWASAVRDDGTFKSAEELRELYGGKGVDPSRPVTAHCRIGERSAHTWFVLRELLGYEDVRNYDGSWTEWGNLVDVPIEKGA